MEIRVKVVNGGRGRGGCGHRMKKSEPYFIIANNSDLISTCCNCVREQFGRIPPVKKIDASDLSKWRG